MNNITQKCVHCGDVFSKHINSTENSCEKCKNTQILSIVVYKDNRMVLVQNGKQVPVTKLKFEYDMRCVPTLTITQPIFDDGLTQNGEVIKSANKGEL